MRTFLQKMTVAVSMSGMLIACSTVHAQKNPYELYDLNAPAQVDHDSYYTSPKGRSNCSTIGDLPSCTDI